MASVCGGRVSILPCNLFQEEKSLTSPRYPKTLTDGNRYKFFLSSPFSSRVNSKRQNSYAVRAEDTRQQRAFETKPAGEVLKGVVLEEGQIFNPTQQVLKNSEFSRTLVTQEANHSLSRHRYSPASEDAVNRSINVAYNVSYTFHGFFSYFDRDNVALENIAQYFLYRSERERDSAEKLMHFQNMRGGKVQLQSLQAPITEIDDLSKGDALSAFELELALEKVQNEKYLTLHEIAEKGGDPEMADYVKKAFLHPQVVTIRRTADFVGKLRRVGMGHGVWHFDKELGDMGNDYNFGAYDATLN